MDRKPIRWQLVVSINVPDVIGSLQQMWLSFIWVEPRKQVFNISPDKSHSWQQLPVLGVTRYNSNALGNITLMGNELI